MEITKNRQSDSVIRQMAQAAFPQKQMESCMELTEGMCNMAYLVKFRDGSKSVLKIASQNDMGRMSNEVNLMDAEVKAMRIVRDARTVRVAEVQYYDTTKSICKSNYFFMEALEGVSCVSAMGSYTEEEKKILNYEIGQIEKRITSIHGDAFGLLGDERHRYNMLYDFVYQMISNVLYDAVKVNIKMDITPEEIMFFLKQDRSVFEEVTQPVLVHWDMWEGNIFVKDKHICGIIDWERAMWGEAFMDDRFRRHTRNRDFLKGYGQEVFTKKEMRRICWYDILLYLTMMTEGTYRKYKDDEVYRWAKSQFEVSWQEIRA